MTSKLIIVPVDKLQTKVNTVLRSMTGTVGIYVSLNKTQKSVEETLKKENINFDKIFFIDCVTKEKTSEDILHCSPQNLEELEYSIKSFSKEIPGEKFILLDALSTLLIYNSENKVAAFVKELAAISTKDTDIIALSPKTKGEELLEKIFNFFDVVKK